MRWLMQVQNWVRPRLERNRAMRCAWDDYKNRSLVFVSFCAMYVAADPELGPAIEAGDRDRLTGFFGDRGILIYFARNVEQDRQVVERLAAGGYKANLQDSIVLPYEGENVIVGIYQLSR